MAEEQKAADELAELMKKLKLTAYLQEAEAWRQNMGAASLDEIQENIDDFVESIKLKPLEIRRIKKHFDPQGGGAAGGTPGGGYVGGAPAGGNASSGLPPGWSGKFGTAPDDFALYEELGTGATATVHRCVKCSSPRESFAVKIINLKNLRMQKEFKRMTQILNREMQILFSLRHPRIVSLYNVIDTDDKLYLVMELMQDGELFDYIVKRGALTEPAARNIFCQVVDALKYIHDKDIVYRDLKPENILVNGKASNEEAVEIKLSDFGHSKLVNDGFSTALTRVGTPQYWAPEVSDTRMNGSDGYDKQVDLWSLGVVLYVMLMGAYPFDGVRAPIEIQIKNPNLQFTSPVTGRVASKPAQDLCKSLIKTVAKQRLSLDGCLEHAWTASASPSVTSKGTSGPSEYCAFNLPQKPTKDKRDQMVKDLLTFQKKFKCFAQVRRDQVIVDLSQFSEAEAREAKSDIRGIIKCQLKYEPLETTIQMLSGGQLDTIPEEKLTTTLKVGRNGAGLDLLPEVGGMRVEGVLPDPGQDLRPNDIIIKINEVPLVGAPETVENIFGSNFFNGVQIQVKRPT